MKIMVIDDTKYWIEKAKEMLSQHDVVSYLVEDPATMTDQKIVPEILEGLKTIDLLLCDKDLGKGITSLRFLATVRKSFPTLPIIRWTGGWGGMKEMEALRIHAMRKPANSKKDRFESWMEDAFKKQKELLSKSTDPLNIKAIIEEYEVGINTEDTESEKRTHQLDQINQIAKLAEADSAPMYWHGELDSRRWGFDEEDFNFTRHELIHIFQDEYIKRSDILPLLPQLTKVFQKFIDKGCIEEGDEMFLDIVKAILSESAEAELEGIISDK